MLNEEVRERLFPQKWFLILTENMGNLISASWKYEYIYFLSKKHQFIYVNCYFCKQVWTKSQFKSGYHINSKFPNLFARQLKKQRRNFIHTYIFQCENKCYFQKQYVYSHDQNVCMFHSIDTWMKCVLWKYKGSHATLSICVCQLE